MDSPLLDADFVSRIEHLRLRVRGIFEGSLRAERRSRKTGAGMEFADYRDYSRGDDLRRVDWNIYGRLDRLVVKILQQERDLAVAVLVDCSGSMQWAPEGRDPARTKWTLARRLAAALTYLALENQDQAGVWFFDTALRSQCGLFRGRSAFPQIVRFLEKSPTPSEGTELGASLKSFASRLKHRGLALVLSDCLDPEGFERGLAALSSRGFEAHVIQVLDPAEREPEASGDMLLRDAESGGELALTASPSLLKAYRQEFEKFRDGVRESCRRRDIGHSLAMAGENFDDIILRNLRRDRLVQ